MSRDVAKRLTECEGWQWLPGMVDTRGARFISRPEGGRGMLVCLEGRLYEPWAMGTAIPDLTDAATMGGVLEVVRRAWDDPHVWYEWDVEYGYTVTVHTSAQGLGGLFRGPTLAEACAVALERRPIP
jgi:hypothetical protein